MSLAPFLARAEATGRVIVVGGGFGGTACAGALKKLEPRLSVTLVEPEPIYTAYPLSNGVLGGLRRLSQQQFGYDKLPARGIALARLAVMAVDASARVVSLQDGSKISCERIVLAPGVDLDWQALPGYSEAAAEKMPHAWKGGAQIALLRRQLEAMEDGGVVGIAIPANPSRCPPGAYERASLIAHYLKASKPRSKLLLLDAKDAFSMQRLFEQAWNQSYPGMIERIPLSQGGNVTSVDASAMTLGTDFGDHKFDVANVIPPQKAAAVAARAGVADRTGWCPVEPTTFESTLQHGVYVLGDAGLMGAMPKSAHAARAQAVACAAAVIASLGGPSTTEPPLANACYSLVAPGYGISTTGAYRAEKGQLVEILGTATTSALDADLSARAADARRAEDWFHDITAETFG